MTGTCEPDLLPRPFVVEAERVDEVLRIPCLGIESCLITRVVDGHAAAPPEPALGRGGHRGHTAGVIEVIPVGTRGHASPGAEPERNLPRKTLRSEVDHAAGLGPLERSLTSRGSRGVADRPVVIVDPNRVRACGPRQQAHVDRRVGATVRPPCRRVAKTKGPTEPGDPAQVVDAGSSDAAEARDAGQDDSLSTLPHDGLERGQARGPTARIRIRGAGDVSRVIHRYAERCGGHEIDDVDRRDGFGTLGFATCGVRCQDRSRSDESKDDGYEGG